MAPVIPLCVIGDCHGYYVSPVGFRGRRSKRDTFLKEVLAGVPCNTVCLGDIGVGCKSVDFDQLNKIPTREGFTDWKLRGNHDDPELFQNIPNALGDFGVLPGYPNIMYFAGADSFNKKAFPGEQMDFFQMEEAYQLYSEVKPEIILSHDCPTRCWFELGLPFHLPVHEWSQNRTSRFLDNLLAIHKPKWNYFAHHHRSKTIEMDGIRFRCVDELEILQIVGGYEDSDDIDGGSDTNQPAV